MFLKELPTEPQEKMSDTALPTAPGFDRALNIFKLAAKHVPAYKHFLSLNHINPNDVSTQEDFKRVPIITKENYLTKYPLKDLLIDGDFSTSTVISSSSGSSGQPFFWPRGNEEVKRSALLHEKLLLELFDTKSRPTLIINAFAMGSWIAGTYTLEAITELNKMGHKLVCVTPGIMREEVVRILDTIAGDFEQVILFGYPPFVKDVIDTATEEKINIKKLNIKFVFAGENISEKWRSYIFSKVKIKDQDRSAFNIYGTADAGFLGCETAMTVNLRRVIDSNPDLSRSLFSNADVLPTIVQYNPEIRFFEEENGLIILTSDNSLPLVRYAIKDKGMIISPPEIEEFIRRNKKKFLFSRIAPTDMPLVALFGRSDIAATFYALNIYPENIKYGLEEKKVNDKVTGKFIVKTNYDKDTQDQTLHISVELKRGVVANTKIKNTVTRAILDGLLRNNSEYYKLHQELGKGANPNIHLVDFGSPEFNISVKHRWVQ